MDSRQELKKTRSPEMAVKRSSHRQLPNLLLLLGSIILLNLCPLRIPFESVLENNTLLSSQHDKSIDFLSHFKTYTNVVRDLMLTNSNTKSFLMADAKVIGKMVKVLYIKKKIKKLGKKLKKHTIAVPVFTAIPVYEHPYFPQPPIAHLPSAAAMHHAAAASSLMPSMAQLTTTMNPLATPLIANQIGNQVAAANQAAMNTAASSTHQQVTPFRLPHQDGQQTPLMQPPANMFHPSHLAAAQQIINHYAPSPPIFVDETGGLYGTYGNAYGRYDGGYHIW